MPFRHLDLRIAPVYYNVGGVRRLKRRIRYFDILEVILTNGMHGVSICKADQQTSQDWMLWGPHTDTNFEGDNRCACSDVLEEKRSSGSYEGRTLAVVGLVVGRTFQSTKECQTDVTRERRDQTYSGILALSDGIQTRVRVGSEGYHGPMRMVRVCKWRFGDFYRSSAGSISNVMVPIRARSHAIGGLSFLSSRSLQVHLYEVQPAATFSNLQQPSTTFSLHFSHSRARLLASHQ